MSASPFSPLYAFDNYFAHTPLVDDPAAQAELARQLGYGATYHSMNRTTAEGWAKLRSWHDASAAGGLPVAAYYTVVKIGEEPPEGGYQVDELIAVLPEGSILELAITIPGQSPSDATHDARAVAWLRELLPAARKRDITLSLYHHIWFWMERIEDCVRVASQVNDPLLRVTFCGYHWFAVDGTQLDARLDLAAPWLRLANLCGSRRYADGEQRVSGLPATIEPVGEGDFPLDAFVSGLLRVGYAGPIGFQGYQIGGEPPVTLRRSMEGWHAALERSGLGGARA